MSVLSAGFNSLAVNSLDFPRTHTLTSKEDLVVCSLTQSPPLRLDINRFRESQESCRRLFALYGKETKKTKL